jgi:hypothetical protein
MLSFNVEGFKRNRHYLSSLLLKKPKLVFLQEIWLPYHDKNTLNQYFPDYTFQISAPDMFQHPEDQLSKSSHSWHGVAIGWRKDIGTSILSLKSTYERFAGIKMLIAGRSILLVSFYAPTAGQDDDYLESISYLTESLQSNMSPGDQVLIGTDCNCSAKSTPRRQHSWKSFCEAFDLETHQPALPTFHHHNGTANTFIDLFAASKGLKLGCLAQQCTLENPLNLSSHDPITTSLKVHLENHKVSSKFSNTYSDFKRQKIIWDPSKLPRYQQMSAKALNDAMAYWDTPETIPLLSSLVSRLLVQCATLALDSKSPVPQNRPHQPSLKIRQAQNSITSSFHNWKRNGKPATKSDPTRLEYTAARARLQMLRRYEDNLQLIRQNNHLMYSHANNRNQVYAYMKRARGDHSDTTTSILHTPVGSFHEEDVLEGFAADAEHLGKSNENVTCFNRGFYNLCKLDNLYIFEFSQEEHHKIAPMSISQLNHILFSKMKSGKACDIYHLTVEHLRHCGAEAQESILALINRILSDI